MLPSELIFLRGQPPVKSIDRAHKQAAGPVLKSQHRTVAAKSVSPPQPPAPAANTDAIRANATASATRAANTRWATVLLSGQANGKMSSAINLLAQSTLSSEKIIIALSAMPSAQETLKQKQATGAQTASKAFARVNQMNGFAK